VDGLGHTPGTVLGTGYDAREIAAVLPLGAVLAGRVFGKVLDGTAPGRRMLRTLLGGRVPGEPVPGGPVPGEPVPGGPVPGEPVPGGRVLGGCWSGTGLGSVERRGEGNGPFDNIDFYLFYLFLVIAGYAATFGYSVAQAGTPGQESAVAGWLVAHGLWPPPIPACTTRTS
jgi:hypothetical protein